MTCMKLVNFRKITYQSFIGNEQSKKLTMVEIEQLYNWQVEVKHQFL